MNDTGNPIHSNTRGLKRAKMTILIIRGGDPAIEAHSALPIGPEAETNRRSDWLTGDFRRLTVTGVSGQCGSD